MDTEKMIIETLSVAQSAIAASGIEDRKREHIDRLQRLIENHSTTGE